MVGMFTDTTATNEEREVSSTPTADAAASVVFENQPAAGKALYASLKRWLAVLPSAAPAFPEYEGTKGPLLRFWNREQDLADRLLASVRHDLEDLQRMYCGETKHTNHLRTLAACLTKAQIPEDWRRYTVPKKYTVNEWIVDFGRRLDQLKQILLQLEPAKGTIPSTPVWLGGLFFPTRFITATRQAAAQMQDQSLEQLHLDLELDSSSGKGEGCFVLSGLHIECARWHAGRIDIHTDELSTPLRSVVLRWTTTQADQAANVLIPIYLNSDRSDLLCSASLPCNPEEHTLVIQRAVALVAGT